MATAKAGKRIKAERLETHGDRDKAHKALAKLQKTHPAAECREVWSDEEQRHVVEIWSGPVNP